MPQPLAGLVQESCHVTNLVTEGLLAPLVLLAGRQLQLSEKLELLAVLEVAAVDHLQAPTERLAVLEGILVAEEAEEAPHKTASHLEPVERAETDT